jgi:2-polyprenyl-3-methyl-5-hydroxy-6-metoxy-1,4-benzoquinol methylase
VTAKARDAGPCLVCGAQDAALLYRLTEYDIVRCRRCDQIHLAPLPTPERIRDVFQQLYTRGEGSVPELKTYYEHCYTDEPGNPLVARYELWLDAIERRHPPGRLLDVGCGTGLFLAVARRRGWEPFGVDDSAEALEHARDHFGLDVIQGEFADFAGEGHHFDLITAWDVIEHARAPVDLLAAMRRCLLPGGVVALSTPNQASILDDVAGLIHRLSGRRVTAPLEKFYIEQHFLYFTPATLVQALERGGLAPLDLVREFTDLERLTLSPPVRLGLHALFVLARLTGRQNRLFVTARAAETA